MSRDPAWFCAAVASGEPDRVGAALDALRQSWPDDRPELLDVCVPHCREVYRTGDGYQRQSVVRFLRALVEATDGLTSDELNGTCDGGLWDTVEATLLRGIRDEDGRVRQSAAGALGALARAYRRRGDDRAVRNLHGVLGTLSLVAGEDVRRYVDRAREAVAEAAATDLADDRLACPRCGEHVERWRFGERETVACSRCEYQGVPVEAPESAGEAESWDDAIRRFKSRVAAE